MGSAYARKSQLWHKICDNAGPRAKYITDLPDLQALQGGNFHWLVVDPMTIYRGVIAGGMEGADNVADMKARFGAIKVVEPGTRISMHDIGNRMAEFCNAFFDIGVLNIIIGMDKGHHSARAMVRILRMFDETDKRTFKPPSPADVEGLHAFVNDVYATLLHPETGKTREVAAITLAREIPHDWLRMVSLDATKQDVLQLGLLSLLAHSLLKTPPRGCRLVICGLQRRAWLLFADHTLQERAAYAARMIQLGGWGTIEASSEGWKIGVPLGSRLSYGLLDGLTCVDDETLVQAVFGEQFTYDLCLTTDTSTMMTHQLGTLEMDHALLAFLYNGLAEEMGGVAPSSPVGFWTGSDTDAVVSWILNEGMGMLEGYKTLLLHTTSAEWNRGNITVVSDPHLLVAQLPVITALMAGCDTIPSIPGLAHAPYFNTLPHISVKNEGDVLYLIYDERYMLLGIRKRTTGSSSRPAGIEVRWFMDNCMAWWQTVLSGSKLPLEQQRVGVLVAAVAHPHVGVESGVSGEWMARRHLLSGAPAARPHRYPLRQPYLAPAARRNPPPPRAGVAVGTHYDTPADGAGDYTLRT